MFEQSAISSQSIIGWPIILSVLLALAVVGLAVALDSKIKRLRVVQKLLHRRGIRLIELIRLMKMAEDNASLGVWHYYPGVQRQKWSGGMKKLFGLESDVELLEGDAETLLAANEIDLVGQVPDRRAGPAGESSQFTIRRSDGSRRTLQLQACRLHEGEDDHVLGVLTDVTDRENDGCGADGIERAASRFHVPSKPVHLVERHRLMGEIDRQVMRFRNDGTPVSLLLVEVVGGAGARRDGCERLRSEIGTVAQEYLRSNDTFSWLGGNLFAWLVVEADEPFAKFVAERLHCTFDLAGLGGIFSDSAVNIGIASAKDGDTALSLFARADGSLDRTKHKSRTSRRRVA